ncbi:MFS transporter [Actinomadura macrotermitis]|uniref:Multidrug resistance protein Stp n=1 Tax=Actinomadura macrotermitis TaxID=2585200 RepID=A0A7K0BPS9_9ACTN|nr:MFS transporter [Actinomadura macrotermitis]MQY02882.1 Multidrug resistance protein Stp [Actinomadura macrotermitis]
MLLDTASPARVPHRRRRLALAALLAAEAMNLLDSTIVQVAAPVIHAGLGGPAAVVPWFSAAYTLPFAGLLITGGRLGDIAGRRRVFRLGVAAFLLASLCCALAPSAGPLIAARAVQGAAAALIIPQTFGLIRAMFPDGPQLARALGCIGPVMGLSAVCGPVLGGVLTHADLLGSSWRSAFLVNLPIAAAVLALAPLLAEDRAAAPPRLDLPGTALVVAGSALVAYPLIESGRWLLFGAGALVLALFGLRQRRTARRGGSPLIEPSLLRGAGFPAALATSVLFFAVTTGLLPVFVLHLQLGGAHADVRTAGLTLLPWSGGLAVASLVAGARLVPRYGARVMFAGLALLGAGVLAAIAVYATTAADAYPWPLLGALALGGFGLGLFTVPFFTLALGRVRPHETGSAAGLLNAAQQFGGTLGVALLGGMFLRLLGPAGAAAAARYACWTAAGLLVATAVTAALMARPSAR